MEIILRESELQWTAVRPPRLTNAAPGGQYRYAVNGFLDRCTNISRAGLAAYLVDHAANSNTYRAVVEVAN